MIVTVVTPDGQEDYPEAQTQLDPGTGALTVVDNLYNQHTYAAGYWLRVDHTLHPPQQQKKPQRRLKEKPYT